MGDLSKELGLSEDELAFIHALVSKMRAFGISGREIIGAMLNTPRCGDMFGDEKMLELRILVDKPEAEFLAELGNVDVR